MRALSICDPHPSYTATGRQRRRLKIVVTPCVLDGAAATIVWCPRFPDRVRGGIRAPQLNVPFEVTVVVHSTVLARLRARSPLR
jgi:hypothetical protein